MSCCEGEEEEQPQQAEIHRVRGCTDVFWLCLFITFWFLMILIAAFALVYGNPSQLIYGYDSFGNTCGMKNNPKLGDMELSGQDTSDKPYLFFLDVTNVEQSIKICVEKCPDRMIKNQNDTCKFYKDTGSKLCYDKSNSDFSACHSGDNKLSPTGFCPDYPVYESTPILNRCIPKSIGEVGNVIISNLYGLLNSWDTVQQILGDLYLTWKHILALSLLAFLLSLCMIAVFHLLAAIVTWVVTILLGVSCIGGTALLWWTYVEIKRNLDKTSQYKLLEESVQNERTFFAFSVLATVITVILLLLLYFLRERINFMAVLFKESAKCLSDLPALFIQPLLTVITLIAFYVFWLMIVLCVATANYPGTKSVQAYKNRIFNALNLMKDVHARGVRSKLNYQNVVVQSGLSKPPPTFWF